MSCRTFLRRLKLFTLLSTAMSLPVTVHAQQPQSYAPQIQVQDGGFIGNPVPQGQGWVNPRVPAVGQGGGQYGDRRVRSNGNVDQHNGIDLPAPVGSPVLAPVSGLVVRPANPGRDGYGNEVRIVDANGNLYILGHLAGTDVQPGAYVEAGQQVGEVGRTGNTPPYGASHVHLEMRDENNQPIPLSSTPATDPEGAAAGFENYLDSLPSMPSSGSRQPLPTRSPTPQPLRQSPQPTMLDRLVDLIIPSASAATLSDAPQQAIATDAGSWAPTDRTQLVMTDDVRQNIAQNAYKPPADIVGDGQSSRYEYDENAPKPSAQGQPLATPQVPSAAPQMTDEQFRTFMAVMMRQFQQTAAAQQQAFDANRPAPAVNSDADSPALTPSDDSNDPRDEARLTFDESVPRNNNVGQPTQPAGNVGRPSQAVVSSTGRQNRVYSIDGSSRPIGASGYRTPVRQNRAYSIDGSSRPIGRSGNAAAAYWGIQQQAYRQIASQQSGGSYAPNYSAGSTGTTVMSSGSSQPTQGSYYSYNESAPAPSARLVFDDNAPRQSVATQTVVTPRQPATAQPTASAMPLSSAITPRQSGAAPRTAGIPPLR